MSGILERIFGERSCDRASIARPWGESERVDRRRRVGRAFYANAHVVGALTSALGGSSALFLKASFSAGEIRESTLSMSSLVRKLLSVFRFLTACALLGAV